jgi:Tfp pilus assembly protein PilO
MVVFVVVLIIGWTVGIYMPGKQDIDQLQGKLDTLLKKGKDQITEGRLQVMMDVVDSLGKDLIAGMNRIYPEEQLLDLGRAIDNIARKFDLALMSVAPDYSSLSLFKDDQAEISELPMMMELSGKFQQMARFLDSVPEFPFVLRVTEMKILKGEQSSSGLTFELRGVIVLRKERSNERIVDNAKGRNRA